MSTKYRVLVGPYRAARNYAESMGWDVDSYTIVVRGHQIAGLDPTRILHITTVKVNELGGRVVEEIQEEIERLRALWPVSMMAAA